ncbi:MAG: hypothetical protein ABIP36_00930 [Acidimicrobiales bacterium]
MPFMVIYSKSDGTSGHEQANAIDEAALLAERLRNSEQSDQIRIYRMEEISFAFRPYFKVELALPERHGPQRSSPSVPVMAPVADVDADPEPDPVAVDEPATVSTGVTLPLPLGGDAEAAANGRGGLFGS